MTAEIEAKEVKVAKLFSSDFIFEIPNYQRPLSWKTDNFDILFEDIFDAINDDENQYFLGTIIIHEHEKANNIYYIVDGQQRLSALAILLAVIRDFPITNQINNLKDSLQSCIIQKEDIFRMIPEEVRIIPWDDLSDIFKKYIYDFKGTLNYKNDIENKLIEPSDEQDPKYHLYEAITVFTKKLNENLTDAKQLERFVIYLLNQVSLVYIKTVTLKSAFRLFNVLNTRGLPLNTSDLLKSENIGLIPDEIERNKYAKIWRDIENNLGRDELENIITFIRTIQIKEKAKFSIYEEYRKNIFEKQLIKKGKDFIDYLIELSDIYLNKIIEGKIRTIKTDRDNEYRNIANLLKKFVPFSDWIPPLLLFSYKFGKDNYLLEFILRLEKKVIIEWMAGFSYTERITSLNKLLKLIELSDNPENVIQELLFYKGEDLSIRTARMLDFSNKNNIESILLDKLNDIQFYGIYGGKLAKYILLRLDMGYWELENFPGYPGTITVEHILPQNPSKNSEWLRIFTEEERVQWTNRLGNLVLLSGRKNSQAQNYSFKDKKVIYFKKKSTPFRITQWLDKNGEKLEKQWNLKELNDRHQLLIVDAKKIFLNY